MHRKAEEDAGSRWASSFAAAPLTAVGLAGKSCNAVITGMMSMTSRRQTGLD
jgi:hypothetical protein